MKWCVVLAKVVISGVMRFALRDKKEYQSDTAIDILDVITGLGLNEIEEMELKGGILSNEAKIAHKLQNSKILDKFSEDVSTRIIDTVSNDFYSWVSRVRDIDNVLLKDTDIVAEIKQNSSLDRGTWAEDECAAYDNCIRFLALIFREYHIALPSFSINAIIELYRRIEEFENNLLARIDNQTTIIEKSLSAEEKHRNYERDYLSCVDNGYRIIELFGSGINESKIRRYDVMTSFVQLSCIKQDCDGDNNPVGIDKVLEENVVWLSGEAGGGKTTFLQWLAVSSAIQNRKSTEVGGLVPIIIKLRNAEFPLDLEKEVSKVTAVVGKKCPEDYMMLGSKAP